MFPEIIPARQVRGAIDGFVDHLVTNYADTLETLSQPVLHALVWLEQLLRNSPWWAVVAVTIAIAYGVSRRVGLSLAMGVLMARVNWLRSGMLPVLDVMQTMPSFVYLIPVVMLFGLGKIPAIIATVIYAVPPLIRLTDLGIRLVDREVLEASRAFGANPRQQLFGVQLPLALPNIMAGINQTTMMALSMVVIASMIGARGLGYEVLLGINRLEVGRGLLAGLGIVVLAVLFDRITQSYGQRMRMGGQR